MLNIKQSVKEINKSVNKDLKSLLHLLNANKISLNFTKTEVVIFRAKGKVFNANLKLKMRGKKLNPSHYVGRLGVYLGVYLDEYLNWATHVSQLCEKANAILSKIRYFVNDTALRSIYLPMFNSYLSYLCTAWGQSITEKCSTCNLFYKIQ